MFGENLCRPNKEKTRKKVKDKLEWASKHGYVSIDIKYRDVFEKRAIIDVLKEMDVKYGTTIDDNIINCYGWAE